MVGEESQPASREEGPSLILVQEVVRQKGLVGPQKGEGDDVLEQNKMCLRVDTYGCPVCDFSLLQPFIYINYMFRYATLHGKGI